MANAAPDTRETREAIIACCRAMNARGVNQGTSGNVSVRVGADRMLITPSGVPYEEMTPEMIVALPVGSAPGAGLSPKPSTEWRFHQSLLASKPEMQAVVHAHPPHATAVACQRRGIGAIHYMIAAFGGADIPLAGYHLFGGPALAEAVAGAMAGRHGCIMANHGAVVVGETLEKALWRMEELELLARIDLLARAGGGEPALLSEAEVAEAAESFKGYGPQPVGSSKY